ncbi:L-threonylcarbamoyladenylate synthase [Candidatus Woesearchaeota archaeon]|nr:L-threonylcarbamoyladenylate synthase [Candidatus Woesearchaeota archaeon]
MEVLTQIELRRRYDEITVSIAKGALFIHPSDTIYGIGCNAVNQASVQKVRALKGQFHQPLSIWVPSLKWVQENCEVTSEAAQALQKLPGPYTIILQLKNKKAVAPDVMLHGSTLGVRLPDHWFSKVVEKIGVPIVTTSANKTGQQFMTTLETLDKDIEKGVAFMIYEGEKSSHPSKIINTMTGIVKER